MLQNIRFFIAGVMVASMTGIVFGQNAVPRPSGSSGSSVGRAQVTLNSPNLAQSDEPLPKDLEDLLLAWARDSSQIQRLEGEHLRRVYDMTFEVEKMSEGKFFFEFPDKGRIDVSPAEVTEAMKKQRLQEPEKVQRKKNGQPFDLESDREEKWICDGRQVYSIDEAKKEAQVVQLPPDLQGSNIMDSPLPFLFGMPPEKAKRRFALSFSRPFSPGAGYAYISALPRTPQDATSWSKAEVILELKSFLPVAVKLTDPAGTKVTVFSFRNMKKNQKDWLFPIPGLAKGRLFEPDLRGYQVVMVGDREGEKLVERTPRDGGPVRDQPRQNPQGKVPGDGGAANTLPDFRGYTWQQAVQKLESMGLRQKAEKGRILLVKGDSANRKDDVNRVQKQTPAPGTPVGPETDVQLWIWLAPAGQ